MSLTPPYDIRALAREGRLAELPTGCLTAKLLAKPDRVRGRTPVHWAIVGGNFADVATTGLLTAAMLAQPDREGWTPVHCAAWHGHLDQVVATDLLTPELLAKPDKWGFSPIYWAAEKGHLRHLPTTLLEGVLALEGGDECSRKLSAVALAYRPDRSADTELTPNTPRR